MKKMGPDSRGIIFCNIKIIAQYLEKWMKDDFELKTFRPDRMVGLDTKSDKEGMLMG